MKEKIPDKFLNSSKQIIEENPDVFIKLQRVMGKVADRIVKNKYIKNRDGTGKYKDEDESID